MSVSPSGPGSLWAFVDRLTTIATLAAAGLVCWLVISQTGLAGGAKQRANEIPQPVETVPDVRGDLPANSRGHDRAPAVLVEFAEFECPYCKKHALETYPQIEAEFVRPGKLRYAFRHLPLPNHANATQAAKAAQCAGAQGQFWQMHKILFREQPSLGRDALIGYAEQAALSMEPFVNCLDGNESSNEIELDMQEAQRLGVKGTPTFLLGLAQADGKTVVFKKRITGAQPYNTFRNLLVAITEGT